MDLYYRLGVIDINIPPLRERTEDIPMLVEHFMENIGPRLKKKVTGIDRRAMDILLNYHWPGNVRELSNIIERAINMADGPVLNADVFPIAIKKGMEKTVFQARPATVGLDEKTVMKCLEKCRNNRSRAAKELGISRSSLYRILKKYSL
jgi:transcriptional regulator with PAS, ATPase and Fis domain